LSHTAKGRDGEDRAAAFLEASGYRIVARNIRLPGGEIDAVAVESGTLVFIEVKSRTGTRFGPALSGVDAKKRATLRRLAADYAQVFAPSARFRFDVVALDGNRVTLHRNAF
jgi:putative endonuclease